MAYFAEDGGPDAGGLQMRVLWFITQLSMCWIPFGVGLLTIVLAVQRGNFGMGILGATVALVLGLYKVITIGATRGRK